MGKLLSCQGLLLLSGLALASVPVAARPTISVVTAISDKYILPDDSPDSLAGTASSNEVLSDKVERPLRIVAAPGEAEPASFVVYSGESAQSVQVSAMPLRLKNGDLLAGARLEIRSVNRWYQSSFGPRSDKNLRYLTPELLLYDDALVRTDGQDNRVRLTSGKYVRTSEPAAISGRVVTRIDELPIADAETLQAVTIEAGENHQFWVTLRTAEDTPPGVYQTNILLQFTSGPDIQLPLEVEVLPLSLADPMVDVSIYYRGRLDRNMREGSLSSEVKSEQQYLADLRNMREHGVSSPVIYQPYGSGQLERVLKLMRQAGFTTRHLFYVGLNIIGNDEGVVPASLGKQVKDIVAMARRYDFDEVYFYGRDEAAEEALQYQLPFWDAVRNAGGKIFAAGWQTDASRKGSFDVTGGNEELFVSLGTLRPQEAARWHRQGRQIYSYQNPTGGYELPETYRRNYGLLLWQKDYDGAMPYAYQDGEGRHWHDFDSSFERDLSFAYPTVNGQIDTLQWEGFREGVDDLRYLNSLLLLLESASGADADAARRWVQQLKSAPLGQQNLNRIRQTIIGFILRLKGNRPVAGGPVELLDVHTGAISVDDTTTVSWRTAGRSLGRVLLIRRGDSKVLAANSLVPVRSHEVEFSNLQPDSVYGYRILGGSSDFNMKVLDEGVIRTGPELAAAAEVVSVNNNEAVLSVELQADYAASIAIDWQQSLEGWWRFARQDDDEVADESGRGRAAQINGDAALTAGYFGRGIGLDGEGDTVTVSGIEIPENGSATIEGWFRFDRFAMDQQRNMALFSGLYQHASNNHFYVVGTNDFFFVSDLLEAKVWHHIALTWSGNTASAAMYIDGRRVRATVQGAIDDMPAIDGFSIGRSSGFLRNLLSSAKGTFAGRVDELRIWSRALSEREIALASGLRGGRPYPVHFRIDSSRPESWRVIGANAADSILVGTEKTVPR